MKFQQIFSQFQKQHMLVIGDAIVDSYFSGVTERLCREAPVPIVSVQQRTEIPGGAANTAVNCATLGAKTTFISVTGKDKEAENLLQNLHNHAIDVSWVQQDEKRQTLTKNRVSVGSQLLVRYDYGTTEFITEETEIAIIDALIDVFPQPDGVIISDYGYCIFTPNVIYTLKKLQEKFPKIIVVDSKQVDHFKSIGITAIKPNYEETTKLLAIPHLTNSEQRLEQIMEYGPHLVDIANTKIAAITLDVDGALIFEKGKVPFRTYTKPTDNTKAIGAGDTYTTALALSLTANATIPSSAEIASAAAMITIRKEGTTSCY